MSYIATGSTLETVANATKIGLAVVQDPALSEVSRLLLQLVAIENKGKAESTPGYVDTSRGIGLKYAVTPVKLAIKVRQHPWMLPTGAVVVAGSLIGLGFLLGRTRRTR